MRPRLSEMTGRLSGQMPHVCIKEDIHLIGSVYAVLHNVETDEKRIYEELIFGGKNLVTDAGDLHYAQEIVGEAVTNAFGILELATGHLAVPAKDDDRADITGFVATSQKVFDATYPTRNDSDGDNPGAGVDVVTYRVSYLTSEANNAAITEVLITNTSPGASEPIQLHADIASFAKTSSDTLKMFVNHTLLGV